MGTRLEMGTIWKWGQYAVPPKIAQRFKNLQKCVICVQYVQSNHPTKEYVETVENIFQNSATKVKIIFDSGSNSYLTKEPFQRCVLKKLCDACGPEFASRFGPIAAKPIRYVREGIKDFNCIICDKNQDLLSYFRLVHAKNKPRDERICCNAFEYRLSIGDKSLWRPPVLQQKQSVAIGITWQNHLKPSKSLSICFHSAMWQFKTGIRFESNQNLL